MTNCGIAGENRPPAQKHRNELFVTGHEKRYHLALSIISEYSELLSTYVYFVENQFFPQSYYSACNLPFEACVVAELLVVPKIHALTGYKH